MLKFTGSTTYHSDFLVPYHFIPTYPPPRKMHHAFWEYTPIHRKILSFNFKRTNNAENTVCIIITNGVAIDAANDVLPVWWMEV